MVVAHFQPTLCGSSANLPMPQFIDPPNKHLVLPHICLYIIYTVVEITTGAKVELNYFGSKAIYADINKENAQIENDKVFKLKC